MANPKRAVVAGGSGFIGSALVRALRKDGYDVAVLSRSNERTPGARTVVWDGATLGDWTGGIEGADLVANFTGSSIDTLWTGANRRRILDSRVNSTRALAESISKCERPPGLWINASAVGFYGDTGELEVSEAGRKGTGFLANVCEQWETAVTAYETEQTRKVILRLGSVLGREGGILSRLAPLAKWFLGGQAGDGRQFISWIHLDDVMRLVRFVCEQEVEGVFNACSPNPVRNVDFMAGLRRAVGRPWSPPVPVWALRAGAFAMRTEVSLLLSSTRAVPQRALGFGFEFQHPRVGEALRSVQQRPH